MVKLSEITSKIGSGATPSGGSSVYSDNGISFIRSQNVLDMAFSNNGLVFVNEEQAYELRNVAIESGDILLNITGDSVARSCVVPENILPARVNQHVSIIRCKDKNDSEYLGFYLQYLKPYLLKICRVGGTRNALTKESIGKLPILYPIDRQEKVRILTLINRKIAINNQINAQLEQMAKTLYDYWFVQFDFPDENGKPYKSSGGEMVYNDTLKREIPKGWEAQKISHWLQSDKSGDWGKEIQEGNYTLQVNCIRGADINAVNFQGNIEAPIRFILPKNKHKLLSSFNLVVEISGGSPTQSTGRLALISDYVLNRFDFPVICSNFCKAISLKNTDYFYQFVFMWNAIYKNDILFDWEGKTSGIKNLLFENFTEGYYECYPPLDLAKKFFEIADVFHKQQQFLLKQNQQLAQLRDFLLPMLMNGQVGVGDD